MLMNIFVTSKCPIESARNLDDKRVIKMCLETAQMLCTALQHHGIDAPYKPTHVNHPCNVWARQNNANWRWLFDHGIALCDEYTERYGRRHKCQDILESIEKLGAQLPDGAMTDFANCARNKSVGVDYTNTDNVYIAYQMYLNDRWESDKRTPTWYGHGR